MKAEALIDAVLESAPSIQYVSVCPDQGAPVFRHKEGVAQATIPSAETDLYEELLVNPVLLELARRRGEIDCGGLHYLVVRYGSFFQLIVPLKMGHLSVCFQETADPLDHVEAIRRICTEHSVEIAPR